MCLLFQIKKEILDNLKYKAKQISAAREKFWTHLVLSLDSPSFELGLPSFELRLPSVEFGLT